MCSKQETSAPLTTESMPERWIPMAPSHAPANQKVFAHSPAKEFLSQGKKSHTTHCAPEQHGRHPKILFQFPATFPIQLYCQIQRSLAFLEHGRRAPEVLSAHIEGIFFIMLVGWITYLIRNSFKEKLLKLNMEDKSHFTQGGKPTQGSTCQNWPPLCTISHILETSPRSWSKELFCTDKLHVTLKANFTFATVWKLHLYEAALIQLPLSSPNLSIAVNKKCLLPSNLLYPPHHICLLWSLKTHWWGWLCTSRSPANLLHCIQIPS